MSMFSEIATEGNVQRLVRQIEDELKTAKGPETVAALKRLGRWALKQFEWDTPAWAAKYEEIFKE
jgi:hypothetical protein